jgi:hypothetical protein
VNDGDLPPPLPDDVSALLRRASRVLPAAPVGSRARVLGRVEMALGPPGGGPSGGGSPGVSAPPLLGAASSIGRALPLAAAFVVGAATGALVLHTVARPPAPVDRVVFVDRPVPVDPPLAPSGTPSVIEKPATVTAAPRPAVVAPSPPSSTDTPSQLDAERKLLDIARGALTRQDGAAALDALAQHERGYPSGILVQEREAMAVRALVQLGRMDDARARADRFLARFPDSVLLPSVEASVAQP